MSVYLSVSVSSPEKICRHCGHWNYNPCECFEPCESEGEAIRAQYPEADSITENPKLEGGTHRVELFRGLVIGTREANGYHDSDFFARYWDDEAGKVEEFMYGTTRGWTYENGATIDASEAVLAKVEAFQARKRENERKAAERNALILEIREAKEASKGRRVTVTSKRSKVPHGTTGVVFWRGRSSYGEGSYRLGFKGDDGETYWLSESCVRVEGSYRDRMPEDWKERAKTVRYRAVRAIAAYTRR